MALRPIPRLSAETLIQLAVPMVLMAVAFPVRAERPPRPVTEIEEDIVTVAPPNNGSGPTWCYGSPVLVRNGGRIFASIPETGEDAPPLCNTRWRIFERKPDGWTAAAVADEYREREPCPLAILGGNLFLSINPSTEPPGTHYGPCEPAVLVFSPDAFPNPVRVLKPDWNAEPAFTDHSYRGLGVDAANNELLLFHIDARTGVQHWSFLNAAGAWAANGEVEFPIRSCYPQVGLLDRAGHILAIGDIVEPNAEWRAHKKEQTGREWDYVFRRLFYAWTPDVTERDFGEPVEIANVDDTAGHIRNLDMWLADDGTAYLLYTRQSVQNALMRDKFFPDMKLTTSLECAAVRGGAVRERFTLARGGEGLDGPEPVYARFHAAPDGRLFVVRSVSVPGEGLKNQIQPMLPEIGAPQTIPLEKPFGMFFTATERGGSPPSHRIDLYGTAGGPAMRYARVRLQR